MRLFAALCLAMSFAGMSAAGILFAGLDGSTLPTRTSDLSGFPNVTWDSSFPFDVSGAAASPEGLLFLCNGAFTTQLYSATLPDSPNWLCTLDMSISGLAYGRGTLYGYANYAEPIGIYTIDPQTGETSLVHDVNTGTGYRFFALGYNPADDLLYGYTEYGDAGLYSIDIDTGEMLRMTGPIPAANTQGRGLAVGDNVVFLTATRGNDFIPHFAYDLAQGSGGLWVEFTNAYEGCHSTGGAAWLPSGIAVDESEIPSGPLRLSAWPNPFNPSTRIRVQVLSEGWLDLALYSVSGEHLATLYRGNIDPGSREFGWDGRDARGRALPSGVYQLRVSAGEHAETLKLILLR